MIMDLLTLRNAAFASVQFCDGDVGEKKGPASEFTGFVCVCVCVCVCVLPCAQPALCSLAVLNEVEGELRVCCGCVFILAKCVFLF